MAPEALILAAGMGSRFGRMTEHGPKALIEFGGEPLLARMIRQCRSAGISNIHIVVGHFATHVEEHVTREFGDKGFTFIHNEHYESTNNILSLSMGLDHLNQQRVKPELLVLECDVILDDAVLPSVIADTSSNVAVVSPYIAGLDGTVVRLTGSRVTEFVPTVKQDDSFDFTQTFKTVNVYKFSPEFWSRKLAKLLHWYVEVIDAGSYYENAIGVISYAGSNDLTALVISSGVWHEVDDPNDLRRATGKFAAGAGYKWLTGSHGGWWDYELTDFFYLRNMYFPPPAMVAQLRGSFLSAIQNYGSSQQVLDMKISWFLGTTAESTLFLAGLSSLYPLMASECNTPDTLMPYPSFGEYADRFPNATTYDPHTSLADLRSTILATTPSRVILVNPNNPSGTLHGTAALVDLFAEMPKVQFIVDESFLPFTTEPSVVDLERILGTNVVVISSLSKTLGVPGLRIGYAWSKDLGLINRYRSELPIWATNSVAEQFISLLPKFKNEYQQSLRRSAVDKSTFVTLLEQIPESTVLAGADGNFINVALVNLGADESLAVCEEFLDHGFLVKCVNEKLSMDHPVLRLAVRTESENRALAQRLAEIARG